MKKKVDIVEDATGNKIVMIHDIKFKGRQNIDWDEVKTYLKTHVGEIYKIISTNDCVYIGNDFPDEYTGSNYTYKLKGGVAKAKANAVLGIPELIKNATGKSFKENRKKKHIRKAAFGWYKYDSYFAIPVYNQNNELERYNVFHASLIIRHDENGKMYLYDIIDIKKR